MVRILQCLCGPERHCIMGIAYEPGVEAEGVVLTEATATHWFKDIVDKMLANGEINPWCHLCHSREWVYEDAKSIFATIDEARPALERAQRANIESRALYDALKSKAERN